MLQRINIGILGFLFFPKNSGYPNSVELFPREGVLHIIRESLSPFIIPDINLT